MPSVINKLYMIIFYLCFMFSNSYLVKVIEITRHGARTPIYKLPKSVDYLQKELAQLTVIGFNQEMQLGKWKRLRYIDNNDPNYHNFLSKKFNPVEIKIISSKYQRTQFSALANVSGLYPGVLFKIKSSSNNKFIKDFVHPPFRFEYHLISDKFANLIVMDSKNDKIFRARNCILNAKNAMSLFKKKENLIEFKHLNDINEDDIIENFLQDDVTNEKEINRIQSKFFSHHLKEILTPDEKKLLKHKLEPIFPEFFKKSVEDLNMKSIVKVTDFLNFFNSSYNNKNSPFYDRKKIEMILRKVTLRYVTANLREDDELKMLSTHLFLAVLGEFEELMNYKYSFNKTILDGLNKYTLYSGHDRNIQDALLNILEPFYINYLYKRSFTDDSAYDFLRVPFSSFVIFELHYYDDDHEFYVKILYNGEEILENLRKLDNNVILYVKNKGFPYSKIKKMLVSRIDMRIKNIEC